MSRILSEKEYYMLNKKAFLGLTPKVRKVKYQAYLAKQKEIVVERKARNERPIVYKNIKNKKTDYRGAYVRNSPNNRIQSAPRMTKIPLSECTLLYAKASIDPFTKLSKMPCIPDSLCVPSFKFCSKVEGTCVVGSNAVGYVLFNPWDMVVNDNGNNALSLDQPIITTNVSYPYPDIEASPAILLAGQISALNSNSPFTVDDFTDEQAQFRLVAAGVEIEYTGQLLNQSGAITTLQNNGLLDVADGTTITQLRNNPRSRTCSNSKENRCYIPYTATNNDVLSYASLSKYRPSELGVEHNHPLIIAIAGATPGITFRFKAVAYFECQLSNVSVTPSEADPIGFPAFQSARTSVGQSEDPEMDLREILQGTIRNIAHSVSGMGGDIGMALGSVFGNPLAGRAAGSAAGMLLSSIIGD